MSTVLYNYGLKIHISGSYEQIKEQGLWIAQDNMSSVYVQISKVAEIEIVKLELSLGPEYRISISHERD